VQDSIDETIDINKIFDWYSTLFQCDIYILYRGHGSMWVGFHIKPFN